MYPPRFRLLYSPQHSWGIRIFIYYHYEFKNVDSKDAQDLNAYETSDKISFHTPDNPIRH